MIIDCAHYRDGRRQEEGPVSLEEAAARSAQGGFVWLGLFEPGPEELAEVQAAFGLHELAVEDAQVFHLRPKVELYERWHPARHPAHRALRRRGRGGGFRQDQRLPGARPS